MVWDVNRFQPFPDKWIHSRLGGSQHVAADSKLGGVGCKQLDGFQRCMGGGAQIRAVAVS